MAVPTIARGALIVAVALLSGVLAYFYVASRATTEARAAIESDAQLRVTRGNGYWTFVGPSSAAIGMVFFPGTPVDPLAYAPLARRVAGAGFPVALVALPWRGLAPDDHPDASARTLAATNAIGGPRRWVLAGHSRGAAFAARLAFVDPASYAGLVLIASVHPRDFSLAGARLAVTQVAADRDGTTSARRLAEARANLPPSTRVVVIRGGNHSQFGFYGTYPFDGTPVITRASQIDATAGALIDALQRAEEGN